MRKTLSILVVATALLFPMAALANHYSNFYVLPIAGKTAGVNNTSWISDVAVQNFGTTPLEVSFVFIASGEGNPNNVVPLTLPGTGSATATIPAGGSLLIRDAVAGISNSSTGAIMVGADRPFALTSRAYNDRNGVGQGIQPARDFLDNSLGTTNNVMATAYLPGLRNNSAFRSNIGFVAATPNGGAPMVVSITVRAADGSSLGTTSYTVPSGALQHLQFSVGSFTNNATFDIGAAELRIVSGNGTVVPYASIIDNVTADGVFVPGNFPPNTASGKYGSVSLFEMAFEHFRR